MRPVRLALVGFGRWGRNYVRAAKEAGNCEVVAVVTSTHANEVPDKIVHQENLTDAVHNCDAVVYAGHPRGVQLATQIAFHARKPILVEKPAALSLSEARRLLDMERAYGCWMLVGHQHLFAAGYEVLQDLTPPTAQAIFGGPVERDYSPLWDYGTHAAACLLGLGVDTSNFMAGLNSNRIAKVVAHLDEDVDVAYDGYAPQEPPLTREVRVFSEAVKAAGSEDWRFGAHWAVDVAEVLTSHKP